MILRFLIFGTLDVGINDVGKMRGFSCRQYAGHELPLWRHIYFIIGRQDILEVVPQEMVGAAIFFRDQTVGWGS